jgi:3-deoxy-D-manno-octulosonate 8-phosphate phosphatase (KDO 8-P phosphatase)
MSLHADVHTVTAVILDIDGVLTDGRIGYGSDDNEIKFFDVKDGHGIKLLLRTGIKVGVFSGRSSAANQRRADELGLAFIYQGEKNKKEAFRRVLNEQGLTAEQVLYIGDDLVDLPVMRQAGIAVAVADAVTDAKAAADWITAAPGGRGAVREVAEWLLKQQGRWDEVTARYLED